MLGSFVLKAQNAYFYRVADTNLIPKNALQINTVNNVLAQTLYNTLGITKFAKAPLAHASSRVTI